MTTEKATHLFISYAIEDAALADWLTKLNYNGCKLGEFQPVTIRFSDEVGEILVTNRKSGKRHPNFKYYI